MFWNAWGSAPKVEKSNLDGTQRVAMVTSNLTGPSGITLDRQNKLVYWVDESRGTIESFDYGGNNRTVLFQQKGLNFYSVTFISPHLFITGWERNWIYKVDVSNGTVSSVLSLSHGDAMGLVAIDSYRRPSAITCLRLPSPSNGTKFGCLDKPKVNNGSVCQFGCYNGYIGSGSLVRRCQQNGTWSGQEFFCRVINCSSLITNPGGPLRMRSCGSHYGAQCNFYCPIGYRLNGSSVITCIAPSNQHPGLWNKVLSTCEAVTCPALMSPANSIRHGCPGNATVYPFNTECQFSCLEGYKLIGSSLRKCQDNGLWSGRESHCKSITCPMLSLPFNAVLLGCNTTGSEMFYGTKCKFFCKEGSVATSSTVRGCSENGTWTGTELVCTGIELHHSLLVKFL